MISQKNIFFCLLSVYLTEKQQQQQQQDIKCELGRNEDSEKKNPSPRWDLSPRPSLI